MYRSGKPISDKVFLTYTVLRDSRKHKSKAFTCEWNGDHWILWQSLPRWVCKPAACPTVLRSGVSSQTWAASLFDFSCSQPPLLQAWTGNSWIWLWQFIHRYTALSFPSVPSLPVFEGVFPLQVKPFPAWYPLLAHPPCPWLAPLARGYAAEGSHPALKATQNRARSSSVGWFYRNLSQLCTREERKEAKLLKSHAPTCLVLGDSNNLPPLHLRKFKGQREGEGMESRGCSSPSQGLPPAPLSQNPGLFRQEVLPQLIKIFLVAV